MPHLPVIIWIVLAIVPAAVGFLLLVEQRVVRPSIEAERRAMAPEAGRVERLERAEQELTTPAA